MQSGEITVWEEMKFRPIISYAQHIWRRWYAFAGDSLSTLAAVCFPLNDTVTSGQMVQQKVMDFNASNGSAVTS